jgi:hypothetical protein
VNMHGKQHLRPGQGAGGRSKGGPAEPFNGEHFGLLLNVTVRVLKRGDMVSPLHCCREDCRWEGGSMKSRGKLSLAPCG